MPPLSYDIRLETPYDDAAIEALHSDAFGPGRFARTAFRIREGVPHDPRLSFVALAEGALLGAVRLTPIRIGEAPAQLLGPLAVISSCKGLGIGRALMRKALEESARLGEGLVLLVGDLPYYGPFGFRRVPQGRIQLPGPVDPTRLLAAELVEGALEAAQGSVHGGRS
ncbi:putative N-acetyltransferase YhbS [Breoghania corrubedonensis]|uniref:Putative N-acetyltransferase YhbS n=1 Tax=Breoghania corrubedonensis TaxID=665038 RepID=A0A2T5UU11_9HYPH|nr:N-acetyltransferase [Breoghania corrubedonensis]PTW54982.1 putative N-acetyltransferase YhbS [Breoghania corrubedonensis]